MYEEYNNNNYHDVCKMKIQTSWVRSGSSKK